MKLNGSSRHASSLGRQHRRVGRSLSVRVNALQAIQKASSTLQPWFARDDENLVRLDMENGMCMVNRRYTPEYIRSQSFRTVSDIFTLGARGWKMVTLIGGYLLALRMDKVLGRGDTREQVGFRAAQLREILTELGPSFIKAGQVLANRPDIMREDYMNELCVLQDDVPSFPDQTAFEIMEESLGRPLEEVFSAISDRPVAAASLGQVYKGVLRETGEEVAIKVQRPGVAPIIYRDLFIFRSIARFVNPWSIARLGCNAELIVDEFGEKLLEELDYTQEAMNIEDFGRNFRGDPTVKIPWVRKDLSGPRVLVMEWVDGIRCTDPEAIRNSGIDVNEFIRCGVVSGLRQLLEFGLFHGDPHPGNIFCMRDGRIAYVDFGNVAQLSQQNKQVLIDAVVHAVNEDYDDMAGDFIKLGFLAPGTDIVPLVPALERIWKDSLGQSMEVFNFRSVTGRFNEIMYQYPIRIPERYALVIRSLLTQEGICMMLKKDFHFLEVAYPYVARRLLTDEDPILRDRLLQVLFRGNKFQWTRLSNLIGLAKEGSGRRMDLSDTVRDALRLAVLDDRLRTQLVLAFTEDNTLHVKEALDLVNLVRDDVDPRRLVASTIRDLPSLSREFLLAWSDKVIASR